MIIGNGLVAKAFEKKYRNAEGIIIFASGVSNSSCKDIKEFERELELIANTIERYPLFHFVYFSTCSIYDNTLIDSNYVQHKLKIEKFIANNIKSYSIFRIPNLVGFTDNPHTILNYLYNCIQNNLPFQLWKNSTRNFLDIDDLVTIADEFIQLPEKHNQIINIASPRSYSIMEIVSLIESFCNKNGMFTFVDKGTNFNINIEDIKPFLFLCPNMSDPNYLIILLNKYFLPK